MSKRKKKQYSVVFLVPTVHKVEMPDVNAAKRWAAQVLGRQLEEGKIWTLLEVSEEQGSQ